MRRHLLFTVQAPLGSWGSASSSSAGQARKPTELAPSRSALIGLLAAALGWRRERLAEVDVAVHLAMRVDLPPIREALPDYQTVTPAKPPKGAERWARFAELRDHLAGVATSGSIQSWREFWTNGCWTVAAVASQVASPSLDELHAALVNPRWPLFAGRKAFTLGLPPDPQLVEAADLVEAFARHGAPWQRHPILRRWFERSLERQAEVGHDQLLFDVDMPGAPVPERQVVRRDRPEPIRMGDGIAGPWMQPRWHERPLGEAWLPRSGGAA